MFGFLNVKVCICVGLYRVDVCRCGFCIVWVCMSGFVMFGCVYVWFCNVWVCVCEVL